MIDVIGTDAGAPASLPAAQQALIRAAEQIAAPRRLQPALETWLESPVPLIDSDDPRHLVEVLTGIQTVKAQNVEMVSRWQLPGLVQQ